MFSDIKKFIKDNLYCSFKHNKGIQKSRTTKEYYIKHNIKNIYDKINSYRYHDAVEDIPFLQKIYNIDHDIYTVPRCKCGKKLKFINFVRGYYSTCADKKCFSYHIKEIKSRLYKERYSNNMFVADTTLKYDDDTIKNFIDNIISKHCYMNKPAWYIKNNYSYILSQIYNRTSYLDDTCSIQERIFNIKNNLQSVPKCFICDKNVIWSNNTHSYRKYCSLNCHKENNRRIKLGTKCSDETRRKMRESSTHHRHPPELIKAITEKTKITINTEEYKKRNREQREKNGVFKRSSIAMKRKIMEGKFTPCITNSWCHSKIVVECDDKKIGYRSSWDAVFGILNKECEYEKLRIPYIFNGIEHIYIVDFIDKKNRVVYEIKPKSQRNTIKNRIKEQALQLYCNINNYKYKLISDDWFRENASKVNYDIYDSKIKKGMKQFIG